METCNIGSDRDKHKCHKSPMVKQREQHPVRLIAPTRDRAYSVREGKRVRGKTACWGCSQRQVVMIMKTAVRQNSGIKKPIGSNPWNMTNKE